MPSRRAALGWVLSVLLLLGGVAGGPASAGASGPRWGPPLAGPLVVLLGFEPPLTPYGPGHRGVDLRGSPGDEVHAPAPGVVVYAGMLAGRGVVSLAVGALRTTFEPVEPSVAAGQQVATGSVLGGLVGGHPSCAPVTCLHWGLIGEAGYLDPLLMLGPRHVRLLPLDPIAAGGAPQPPRVESGHALAPRLGSASVTARINVGPAKSMPSPTAAIAGIGSVLLVGIGWRARRLRRRRAPPEEPAGSS